MWAKEPEGDADVQERLAYLERVVLLLRDADRGLHRHIDDERERMDRIVSEASAAADGAVAALRADVNLLAVGGLRLEALGVTLLALGAIAGTIPDAVAQGIRWLGGFLPA